MANDPNLLRIATRQSRLALWQAEYVATRLLAVHPQLQVVLVPMTTQGDRIVDRSLAEVGGKGLFIKELEIAMDQDRADIAVHSMKDVPSELPDGMTLAAMLPRADPRDAFISTRYDKFESLPSGARVGTSSPRRRCQIKHTRPDLEISDLRGNVETRLRKLDQGEFDAIILATAGLVRLDLGARITHHLDPSVSLPAPGQGVIGIECRAHDTSSIERVRVLNDAGSSVCCIAERAFARHLQGNCFSPIAAYAELASDELLLRGAVGSLSGEALMRDSIRGKSDESVALGTELAMRMLNQGARELMGNEGGKNEGDRG
jgi:hydroxymethylbilane synthase